jgi:pyruvate dehydrogenase E2 component (dihydrolipoamide acetyltransferase)
MPTELTMPKLSDTMEEGTVLRWQVAVGSRVERGQVIAEVETDKASMEMEAFESGEVLSLEVPEGETVAVGTVIAILGEVGECPAEKAVKRGQDVVDDVTKNDVSEDGSMTINEHDTEDRVVASPAARKLAREQGVDLSSIKGTGPAGRIVAADVEQVSGPEVAPSGEEGLPGNGKSKKSVKIRRLVARKMVESWQNAPHFFVTVAVDMTDVIRFRKSLGVSINDFILAATAAALKEHPWVNSFWVDGEAVEQKHINIAMAVATEQGLYNPVIKECEDASLKQISRRAAELADRAHHGRLQQSELEGGTFTISNMGMLGVESFSAIVTPPQAAVLAVGTVKGEVIVDEHEELTVAPMVRLTLSADHRILDGADAAEFLDSLKSYLEAPVTLVAGTCFEDA